MASSSSRPWRLRMRADIVCQKQSYQGRNYWMLKDPISLKYYRFEEEEFALLRMLDGVSSPDQIKLRFDYEFAPQKITLQELFQFVGMLYRSCLLVSDGPNQGVELLARGQKNRRQQFRSSLTNVLAIRFRGFDPDRLLGHMNGWLGWIFSWPCFLMTLILGASAGALLFSNFEVFQTKLPSFQEFFAAKNWVWLALVMGLTKVIHEFGHGLACKRFGSQCHEMGLMLLVLTPCLYCNVSDSWTLPNKWKRAAISAAGMYVELVMASIAVFVWWFSHPGIVNQLALNVIFVCSVSTLLFNANPLLRYDGYYILSDLLEIPNLLQKATTLLQRAAGQWLAGIEPKPDPFLPHRRKVFFVCYAIAAAAYRWLISLAIFWFVYGLLEPYGLKVIGQLVAFMALYGLVGMPLVKLWKFFSVPGRMGTVKPKRASIAAFAAALAISGIMLIPIPRYVVCSFYVEPALAENVYIEVPGMLAQIDAAPLQKVVAGQPIVHLHSRALNSEIRILQDAATKASIRLRTYQKASQLGTPAAREAANSRQEMEVIMTSAQKRLTQRREDLERLVVRSPISGVILAPTPVKPQTSEADSLGRWDGTPLDQKNLGAYLDTKTQIARIVPDLSATEAHLAIDQSEIEFIRPGLDVELMVDQMPTLVLVSTTEAVSPSKLDAIPKQLSSQHGGDLLASTTAEGREIPLTTHYLVRVPIPKGSNRVVIGATGTAKIRTGSQTIGARLWRLAMQTFRFSL